MMMHKNHVIRIEGELNLEKYFVWAAQILAKPMIPNDKGRISRCSRQIGTFLIVIAVGSTTLFRLAVVVMFENHTPQEISSRPI